MAWGNSSNVSTTNLDSGSDSPALARVDLKAALDELTAVIDGRGAINGVASLDASALIPNTQIPNTLISSSGNNLTLDPATGKVSVQEVLNLQPQTVTQLNTRTDVAEGDVAFCSNGDAGNPCVAVALAPDSAGEVNWYKVTLGALISDS